MNNASFRGADLARNHNIYWTDATAMPELVFKCSKLTKKELNKFSPKEKEIVKLMITAVKVGDPNYQSGTVPKKEIQKLQKFQGKDYIEKIEKRIEKVQSHSSKNKVSNTWHIVQSKFTTKKASSGHLKKELSSIQEIAKNEFYGIAYDKARLQIKPLDKTHRDIMFLERGALVDQNPVALYFLGDLVENEGFKVLNKTSEKLYREAAKLGQPDAMLALGLMLMKNESKDEARFQEGVDWVIKADRSFLDKSKKLGNKIEPELNYPISKVSSAIAMMLERGIELRASKLDENKEAGLDLIKKAAELMPLSLHQHGTRKKTGWSNEAEAYLKKHKL